MSAEEFLKTIGSLRFSLLSPSETRAYSVVEITAPETYDRDGLPIPGGLMDLRLGVLEPGQKCATCGNTSAGCPGHFGHIELADPVIHVAFVEDIHTILSTTCGMCHRVLLNNEDAAAFREVLNSKMISRDVLEKVVKEARARAKKTERCPHCGARKHPIVLTKPTEFHEQRETGPVRLLPSMIREWFEEIKDPNLSLIGYDIGKMRPEWMILQVLPVPPVAVRPSITLESGLRSEDDLTHKLADILRANKHVKDSKGAGIPTLILQDLLDLLQYHVNTYFDNELPGVPPATHRSGRPLRSLGQRLKGKEGIFRGNLSGKRVNFSSRTVISPDPSLEIDEVGVPVEVAMKLTVPERVTLWNIERLRALVRNGDKYPGANYVIMPNGIKIRLEYVSDRDSIADSLEPGCIVERHLLDGDIALFNRQPSLHRISIMAHKIRVLPYRTFRLHPAVCLPYNADFDGDEMNLHIPQSEESLVEASSLMAVPDQILSPRYGGPIIGAIRDYVTASYLLTKEGTWFTKDEFMNLAYVGGYTGPLPEPEDKERGLYSGKQLFSLFLPRGFNYVASSSWGGRVVVKDGKLLDGVIDKASIGAEKPDSLLHRIVKDYGPEKAKEFLNSLSRVLQVHITSSGFSTGYDSLKLQLDAKKKIEHLIHQAYERVEALRESYARGTLQPIKGLSPEESLELYIMNELSRARDRAGKTVEEFLRTTNPNILMARTGARGSMLNIGQMSASLGQQAIRGRRVTRGFTNRTLSHFKIGDLSPPARGFAKSNFRDGLNPLEFFFHAMAGRDGLVDTAVRTQQSGYLQRRLIHAMEHLRVEYDLSVRDPEGNVIQFIYGEDGVDPAKSDYGKAVNVARLIEAEKLLAKREPAADDEIETLLKKVDKMLNPKLLEELRKHLLEAKLPLENVKNVVRKCVELFHAALIEPGEAVGVVSAQSIGEPGTQMTLRTFHFAGIRERDVTLGLPRLIELLDARREPSTPAMDVYLLPEYSMSQEKALEVSKEILFVKFEDIVSKSQISPEGRIIFELNTEKAERLMVKMEEVVRFLESFKKPVEVTAPKVVAVSIPVPDPQQLVSLRKKILSSKLSGIPGIVSVAVVRKGHEWMLQTKGSNLAKVLAVKGVDPRRTRTNVMHEIYTVLGIEAVRNALFREIVNVLEEQGLEVDHRHISLIVDLMTHKGTMEQVGRYGLVGMKSSVLARAAFEITVPTLARAAINQEIDLLSGVTENVIVGLPIPVGTGMVNLFMKMEEHGESGE